MENYIVRIYRRTNHKPEMVVGIVEKPDSDESWEFGTIEELCNILVHRQKLAGPKSPKQTIEQRRFRRFLIKEDFLIFDSEQVVGEVIDISMGGLAFNCLNGPEFANNSIETGILRGEDGFRTEILPCRKLRDHEAPPESSFARMESRRCRVGFGELNPGQRMQLLHIIQNFTICEE